MFDVAEATARWTRVREMMERHDLDLVLAIDLSRDEILQGHQRWLTGYIAMGGPAATLLHRNGHIELISERIGKPVTRHYQTNAFPIELVNGFTPALLAERIGRLRPRRLGIAGADSFPASLAGLLGEQPFPPELVDASLQFQRLRLRKSAYELALIRRSCAIADAVWEQVPDIVRIGRKNYEVVADIDHHVRLQGAEAGFHLVLPLPFAGRPMRSVANPATIEPDTRYLVEISPRCDGYYAQLTLPVTSRADDQVALDAYQDLVDAKQAALPLMRPGADLSQVARSVSTFLADRGHTMTSLSLGHFCGMALEEPRHDPSVPFKLEDGMTLIFHPILAEPEFQSLMRADTYLITESGAERLTRYDGGMLTLV